VGWILFRSVMLVQSNKLHSARPWPLSKFDDASSTRKSSRRVDEDTSNLTIPKYFLRRRPACINNPSETADLQGRTRWTEARSDRIADDDRKLVSTGSRVQVRDLI